LKKIGEQSRLEELRSMNTFDHDRCLRVEYIGAVSIQFNVLSAHNYTKYSTVLLAVNPHFQ